MKNLLKFATNEHFKHNLKTIFFYLIKKKLLCQKNFSCMFSFCHSKWIANEYPLKVLKRFFFFNNYLVSWGHLCVFSIKERSIITNEVLKCKTSVEVNTMFEAQDINDDIKFWVKKCKFILFQLLKMIMSMKQTKTWICGNLGYQRNKIITESNLGWCHKNVPNSPNRKSKNKNKKVLIFQCYSFI